MNSNTGILNKYGPFQNAQTQSLLLSSFSSLLKVLSGSAAGTFYLVCIEKSVGTFLIAVKAAEFCWHLGWIWSGSGMLTVLQ